MAQHSAQKGMEAPLVDRILQSGKQAFDPELSVETRRSNTQSLHALLDGTSTLSLLPVLNLLIQPGRVPQELHAILLSTLARLPLRRRGVQHTIEFILSVHPSTSNASGGTGRGSNISHEALNAASRLLSSPPAGISALDWFNGIRPQLFSLLEGDGEPGMDKAAAYIIGFGILGRKQFGAPGMPGWVAIIEPILGLIDPLLLKKKLSVLGSGDFIQIIGAHFLVSSGELAKSLNLMYTLVTSHPHPSLSRRLLRPILLPLWYLSSWQSPNENMENTEANTETMYRKPARILLKILLQLFATPRDASPNSPKNDLIASILSNFTSKGRTDSLLGSWSYAINEYGGIFIEKQQSEDVEVDFANIDRKVNHFIELLDSMPDLEPDISALFMVLCRNWFVNNANSNRPSIFTQAQPEGSLKEVQHRLIEAKLIQQMISKCPNKLVSDSRQVLDLVNQVFSDFLSADSGKENEVGVSLSLLNIVLTSPNFRPNGDIETALGSIKVSLDKISKMSQLEVSTTARNLLLFLTYRNSMEDPDAQPLSTPTARQAEDRKTYNLAMSYLTATDSPPPVRAQGLELISTLIRANSPVLDIPALLVLFSSLLQDNEEYIYLKAIQSFTQLSQKHPKAAMKDLLERYVDATEEYDLDQRLRLGEALHNVMKSNYLAVTGELSLFICEGLLFIASRLVHRPKTSLKQENSSKTKHKQNAEAEEAWGGAVPQLDEVLDLKESQANEILSQIVSGWESQRGTEDIRIRASALSILGSAIEINISGIGSTITSKAIDLSIHILTLESEPEKGILRRSAILLIMSFIKGLDLASKDGKKLGFGLVGKSLEDVQRILEYVESTDNDGLVKQHARDVIEGLQAWQMNVLIPPQREDTELKELAGLTIMPRGVEDASGRIRPRIEEIE